MRHASSNKGVIGNLLLSRLWQRSKNDGAASRRPKKSLAVLRLTSNGNLVFAWELKRARTRTMVSKEN
jgi:hypothetical protein